MQRHASLTVALGTAHLGSTQTAGALDADSLGTGTHGRLLGLAHGATECDAGSELLGDSLGDQLGIGLGVLHLEDVELDLLAGELLKLPTHPLGLGTVAPDDDARASSGEENGDALGATLDLDGGDTGTLKILLEPVADLDILAHQLGILLLGVPASLVIGRHTETETMGVDFLAHVRLPSWSRSGRWWQDGPSSPSWAQDGHPWARQPR